MKDFGEEEEGTDYQEQVGSLKNRSEKLKERYRSGSDGDGKANNTGGSRVYEAPEEDDGRDAEQSLLRCK